MKKRIIYILLIISIILGVSANKASQQIKTKNVKEILKENDRKQLLIEEWSKSLNKSNFSERQKEILNQEFLPYLLENFDMYNLESLANLLSATENTHISYIDDYRDDNKKASYNNILGMIPFGNCFTDGTIILDENYTDNEFLHEYYHCTQGWMKQHYIYDEAYASLGSKNGYLDLSGIFTMLGYLGNKEYLLENLINKTMNDYWSYLSNLYPNDEKLVKSLKDDIEKIFIYTYKSNVALRFEPFQKQIRNEVLEKITYLYKVKYNKEIENDMLFQVLMSMYNLDNSYHIINNPLLEDKLVYTFHNGVDIHEYTIDESNRFVTSNQVLIKK